MPTQPLVLSILDQSPIRAGGTAAQAINESVELARAAERLGYFRYWVAEHHSSDGLAGTAPEILVARLAAATSALRVGSGGVMLSHYSALKVAETFRVLEALYPGRIDLGIGRAPGSDFATARALQHGPGALGIEHFPNQIADLLGFLRDALPPDHPFAGVHAQPQGATAPEVWLLGSSDQSAAYAAHFGCAFSFAHFITDHGGAAVMAAYREHFRPSPWLAAPLGSVGVFVLCAETEAEAQRLALSRDLWRVRLDQGILGPIPSIEEAEAYAYSREERLRIAYNRRRQVVGTPEQVRAGLLALAAAYGVDEIVVVSICYDFAARRRSYELLADAFDLAPRA
ncbi:MAG TPA: LLM class flavin-dependent oxidoreductase [Stellaceae bacterium]|nr:LLM class flavin-dependent oxidoreductase [Stellaceae bacterium]